LATSQAIDDGIRTNLSVLLDQVCIVTSDTGASLCGKEISLDIGEGITLRTGFAIHLHENALLNSASSSIARRS
jgi:hypothetical protein